MDQFRLKLHALVNSFANNIASPFVSFNVTASGGSDLLIGYVQAINTLASGVAQLMGGRIVDRFGGRLKLALVMSVASLFLLRRRRGWRKLRVVSFAYPLLPLLFVAVGLWMIVRGVQLKPFVSLAAVVTIATGALVYHLRLKSHQPKTPALETY